MNILRDPLEACRESAPRWSGFCDRERRERTYDIVQYTVHLFRTGCLYKAQGRRWPSWAIGDWNRRKPVEDGETIMPLTLGSVARIVKMMENELPREDARILWLTAGGRRPEDLDITWEERASVIKRSLDKIMSPLRALAFEDTDDRRAMAS